MAKMAGTPTSAVTVRRKRPRVEPADDPFEPSPPRDFEPVFDDIEPEPEILRPSTPPLVQARRRRASPSPQVVEDTRGEQALDANQECYKALCTLRAKVWRPPPSRIAQY